MRVLVLFIFTFVTIFGTFPTSEIYAGDQRNWEDIKNQATESSEKIIQSNTQTVHISAKDINRQAYVDTTSFNLRSKGDTLTALKMQFAMTLATEYPKMPADDIAKKVNAFDLNYRKIIEGARTGMNPTRIENAEDAQFIADAVGDLGDAALPFKVAFRSAAYFDKKRAETPDDDYMLESQKDLSFDNQYTNTQRAIEQFADMQQKDSRLKTVAKLTIDSATDTSIDLDAKTQWAKNTEAASAGKIENIDSKLSETRDFLEKRIGKDGSLTLTVKEFETYTKSTLTNITDKLTVVGDQVAHIDDWVKKQQERELTEAQQKAELFKTSLQDAAERSSVNLLSGVLSFVDKEASRKVAIVGNALLDMQKAYESYKAASAAANAAGLATASNLVMMSNMFTASLAIASAFSNSKSGDELIMEQIAKLFEFLEKFRAEMNDRFDAVDRKLNYIYDDMMGQFHDLMLAIRDVSENINEVKLQLYATHQELTRLSAQLLVIDQRIDNFSQDVWEAYRNNITNDCLDVKERASVDLSSTDIARCLGDFANFAATISTNLSSTQQASLAQADYVTWTSALISKNVLENINLLAKFSQMEGYKTNSTEKITVTLPNVGMWRMGADGYLTLLDTWSKTIFSKDFGFKFNRDYQKIKGPGQFVDAFISTIQQPDFTKNIFSQYGAAWNDLIKSLQNVWQTVANNEILNETLTKDLTVSGASAQQYLQSAGIPAYIKSCEEPERFPPFQTSDSWTKNIPEEIRLAHWTRGVTSTICYKFNLTGMHGRVFLDKTASSDHIRSKDDVCTKDGESYRGGHRCFEWTPYNRECFADLSVSFDWKLQNQVNTGKNISIISSPSAKNFKRTLRWVQPKNIECTTVDHNQILPIIYTQVVNSIKTDQRADYQADLAQQKFNASAYTENGANILAEIVKTREKTIEQNIKNKFLNVVQNSFSNGATPDLSTRTSVEKLDFRYTLLLNFLKLGFSTYLAQNDEISGVVFGKSGILDSQTLLNYILSENFGQAVGSLQRQVDEDYSTFLRRTTYADSNAASVLFADINQLNTDRTQAANTYIQVHNTEMKKAQISPVQNTLEMLDVVYKLNSN